MFITTNNLATNPRLVKEIDLALANNFKVDLICFEFNNWSKILNDELKNYYSKVNYIPLCADSTAFIYWVLTNVAYILAKQIFFFKKNSLLINSIIHNKRTFLILNELRKHYSKKYTFIVSHNLGALYPAFILSKKIKCPFHFDIEDFHPGEKITRDINNEIRRRKYILKIILPYAKIITFASPEIGNYTLNNIKLKNDVFKLYIPNCFKSIEFSTPVTHLPDSKLRLVWFSQNITFERGLENILNASVKYASDIEIHLYGNLNPKFSEFLKEYSSLVILHQPLAQKSLHIELRNYDVGLALELSSVDINKDIAISNKIYAYAQAGLYILATNTLGQKHFIKQYPWSGFTSSDTVDSLDEMLGTLIKNKIEIRKMSSSRYHQSKNISWDQEANNLLLSWMKIF